MAISDIYNSLTFGGVNSLDYGIYISGPGVFNAPTRAVTFVDVPGRNGAIEIDEGHWNNIEVRYTAGTFGDGQSDFASKINAFRNAIVSQIGYQRITDTYNPEEYRLGIYASGLSVNPENKNEAGEFELVFNCKPQRYLLEGEGEIAVTSGDTITNPTLYDAGPLLIVKGYGNIHLGDNVITLNNDTYGVIEIGKPSTGPTITLDTELLEVGDEIYFSHSQDFVLSLDYEFATVEGYVFRGTSDKPPEFTNYEHKTRLITQWDRNLYNYGTSNGGRWSNTNPAQMLYIYSASGTKIGLMLFQSSVNAAYDGDDTITLDSYYSVTEDYEQYFTVSGPLYQSVSVYANSTKSVLGAETYIDTEIGDAYKIEGGKYYGLNRYIALPSDLPKLKPGENEITFDNTITELKIVPRWWEL